MWAGETTQNLCILLLLLSSGVLDEWSRLSQGYVCMSYRQVGVGQEDGG